MNGNPIPSDTHSKNVCLTKVTITSTAIPSTVAALYHRPPRHFRDEARHLVEFELAWKVVVTSW
jgi:hypothetical protein